MIGIKSDVGNLRKLNEDYAEFYEDKNFKVFVVADGMGGHNSGEIASKIATKSLIKYVKDNFKSYNIEELLRKAIKHANLKVYNLAYCNDNYNGMGTTLVACLISDDMVQIANVGDSSCFGINDNGIVKITKDHSLVQELLDSGSISEEEAIKHPKKNVITRAIGTKDTVEIDVFNIEKDKFKFFLMCSDGLTNEINVDDISLYEIKEMKLQGVCERLVELAKVKGGRDNITVILFGGEV